MLSPKPKTAARPLSRIGLFLSAAGVFCASSAFSQVDFVSILNNEGKIFNLNTTTLEATEIPWNVTPTTGEFSPNSLGFDDGVFYYSTFGIGTPADFYSSDFDGAVPDNFAENVATGNTAAGDAFNGNYYFLDNKGGFGVVDVDGTELFYDSNFYQGNGGLELNGSYGDIAMQTATTGFLSFDGGFTSFTLDLDPGALSSGSFLSLDSGFQEPNKKQFLGLAFGSATGALYGVANEVSGYNLYKIDTNTMMRGDSLGLITGGTGWTDLAASPIPEPSVYVGLAFALGLFGYRRFKSRSSKVEALEAA